MHWFPTDIDPCRQELIEIEATHWVRGIEFAGLSSWDRGDSLSWWDWLGWDRGDSFNWWSVVCGMWNGVIRCDILCYDVSCDCVLQVRSAPHHHRGHLIVCCRYNLQHTITRYDICDMWCVMCDMWHVVIRRILWLCAANDQWTCEIEVTHWVRDIDMWYVICCDTSYLVIVCCRWPIDFVWLRWLIEFVTFVCDMWYVVIRRILCWCAADDLLTSSDWGDSLSSWHWSDSFSLWHSRDWLRCLIRLVTSDMWCVIWCVICDVWSDVWDVMCDLLRWSETILNQSQSQSEIERLVVPGGVPSFLRRWCVISCDTCDVWSLAIRDILSRTEWDISISHFNDTNSMRDINVTSSMRHLQHTTTLGVTCLHTRRVTAMLRARCVICRTPTLWVTCPHTQRVTSMSRTQCVICSTQTQGVTCWHTQQVTPISRT